MSNPAVVIGILLFLVLLGFGSTWDGPDLELIMGDPQGAKRRLFPRRASLRYIYLTGVVPSLITILCVTSGS